MESKHAVRGAIVNSVLILSSRILGLVRDAVMLAVFGVTPLLGAFNISWVVPNLFRRLLGEGAVSAAIQPALAKAEENHGPERARQLFQGFQATVFGILLGILIIVELALLFHRQSLDDPQELSSNLLTILLLPYMVPICMCALASAPQNLNRHFFWPAFAPIILNICWLISAFSVSWWLSEQAQQLTVLSCGLLLGGVLQWAVQLRGLSNIGWRFKMKFGAEPELQRQTLKSFAPALIGMAALQVNLLVDQFLVRDLVGLEANTYTFTANRLIQLPMALVGIAAMTGAMPLFARLAAKGETAAMNLNLRRACEATTMLMLCAMAGLLVLALPIIRVLFERGEINAIHSVVFADTLKAYLFVVPIAAISGLLSRAYHALHSYKLPMYAALMAVPINITLDYLWLPEHGTPAAGWATAVAMLAQLLVLIAGLSRHHLALPLSIARSYTWVLPSVGVLFCSGYVHREFLVNHPITNLLASIIAGVIAAVVIMAVTRREDLVAFTRAVSKPK